MMVWLEALLLCDDTYDMGEFCSVAVCYGSIGSGRLGLGDNTETSRLSLRHYTETGNLGLRRTTGLRSTTGSGSVSLGHGIEPGSKGRGTDIANNMRRQYNSIAVQLYPAPVRKRGDTE